MKKHQHWHRAEEYYHSKGWTPFDYQLEVLAAIKNGQNGMLNIPTGFGKTNALMVPVVLDGLAKFSRTTKTFAIWVTPLRALSKEIYINAEEISEFYEVGWIVASRNGDTPSSERQKQSRKPPQILITTPESLHLMLAQKKYQAVFSTLEYFIVDEWHELIGSKRGVQVELALSRLKTLAPNMKIWGISATIGNLDEAEGVLLGHTEHAQNKVRVTTNIRKKVIIESLLPEEEERYPWAGHLGVKMAHKVLPILDKHQSTLIFTNTRSQAELWYRTLLEIAPELAGIIAMHHSSMNRELRDWVESALEEGKLKAVVCTSSLDLGVDFHPVDAVIQVGGPKGVARFLQRAGRSGHRPGAVSKIYFLPTHSIELLEAAALREAAEKGKVEKRQPYIRSFDVLAQYLVTLAVSEGFYPQEIYQEILTTHCFESISPEEYAWLLIYITEGGKSLEAYDEFNRVTVLANGLHKVEGKRTALRHRLSIGTIVSDSTLVVKYMKGSFLGTIEEWFVSKLQPGEIFWFAGRNLELVKVKENTVYVKKTKSKKQGKVPAWMGGRMPLSSMLGEGLRKQLTDAAEGNTHAVELESILPTLETQRELSALPKENELLIEYFKSREGYHLLVYPFEGRFVHEGLAALLAYRISLLQPISFSLAANDYGFELLSDQGIPVQEALDNDFLSSYKLKEHIEKSVNATEMARRQFRDIASISGLVFQGYPGKMMKEKHLQASSQLYFNVFSQYDPDNLFLRQAYEEAYYHQLEMGRLQQALQRIESMDILWTCPEHPTPFAFPIMVDRLRSRLSSEKLEDRIKRMQVRLDK